MTNIISPIKTLDLVLNHSNIEDFLVQNAGLQKDGLRRGQAIARAAAQQWGGDEDDYEVFLRFVPKLGLLSARTGTTIRATSPQARRQEAKSGAPPLLQALDAARE